MVPSFDLSPTSAPSLTLSRHKHMMALGEDFEIDYARTLLIQTGGVAAAWCFSDRKLNEKKTGNKKI